MAITNFPDIRQADGYSCGAAASMAVGLYYKVGPKTLPEWKTALGTDVQHSTNPRTIAKYFRKLGRSVDESRMDIGTLAKYTDAGCPVICPVQDYGPARSRQALFNYGHYLTVIDVVANGAYIVCQDSSEDNIIKRNSDSIQDPGKILVTATEWMKVWHDRNVYGEPFINWGIAIS